VRDVLLRDDLMKSEARTGDAELDSPLCIKEEAKLMHVHGFFHRSRWDSFHVLRQHICQIEHIHAHMLNRCVDGKAEAYNVCDARKCNVPFAVYSSSAVKDYFSFPVLTESQSFFALKKETKNVFFVK
jgi:hypothetical protein